jgi:lincosamide nucleotidyltransferase A/C/D/E
MSLGAIFATDPTVWSEAADSGTETEERSMEETDVLELYALFRSHDLDVVVDGGWGVDALLGYQSRPHCDLDVALRHEQVPLLRRVLADRDYVPVDRPDTTEWNFVLGDSAGRQVDVHSFTFEPPLDLAEVDPSAVPDDKSVTGVDYPRLSLYGFGMIAGTVVRCVPPEYMVLFHTGYPLDEDDFSDTSALCAKFGIALPAEYDPFVQRDLEERR